jgi:glycosyltransferase involved in cell wall biosynthesis
MTKITFAGPVPPIAGGIASHSACTIGALRETDADVRVVSWASQYPKLLYKGSGIDPQSTPFPGAEFSLRWWDPTSWARTGRRARHDDLLVLPWVTPVHAVPQWFMHAAARGVPMSLMVHNAIPHERIFGPLDTQLAKFVMRRAAQIVVHAEILREKVNELAPGVPVEVVMHPPQLPVKPTPLPHAPPLRLLCLGFVRDYKGFDLAVDALRVLRERGVAVELTIAGEIWGDPAPWGARAQEPGVTLLGRYLPDDEVVGLLASHHVLVAPYRSATQSGPIALAFGAGRPVVASAVGGLAEAVTDGENGRLVEPDNVDALVAGIQNVGNDLERYAKAAAATDWQWRDVASALLRPVRR